MHVFVIIHSDADYADGPTVRVCATPEAAAAVTEELLGPAPPMIDFLNRITAIQTDADAKMKAAGKTGIDWSVEPWADFKREADGEKISIAWLRVETTA